MVHELHKLGYQWLRIAPSMAPSGAYWRCTVTNVANISPSHGARLRGGAGDVARYTSGQVGNNYFGWDDARRDTPYELAEKFIERFAHIAQRGHGEDKLYANWYEEMLSLAEKGALPFAFDDSYARESDPNWLQTTKRSQKLPMPPGLASAINSLK